MEHACVQHRNPALHGQYPSLSSCASAVSSSSAAARVMRERPW
jgi:hypothetical protein